MRVSDLADGGGRLRVGHGQDTHRVVAGGPLRLGGVDIPCELQLEGHSDADVLLHAVTDALLGATGNGDIGERFPDTDPDNRGRDSAEMLRVVAAELYEAGVRIENMDCTVCAQRPRLTPHKQAVRQRIAGILNISEEQIGLKAKTGELVGPVGRGEAITADCVVLLFV